MAAADVNWFLSSLAQSTAALIAIIGGLLATRYVSLHAEQEAAGRRVADLARRVEEAQGRHVDAQRRIHEFEVADVLEQDAVYAEIVDRQFSPTRAQVLRSAGTDERDVDASTLDRRVEQLSSELRTAVQTLMRDVPDSDEHENWDDFRRDRDYPISTRRAWDWAYEQVTKAKARAARESRPSFGPLDTLRRFTFTDPQVLAIRNLATTQLEQAAVDRLYAAREQASAEQRQLREERRLAQEVYDATRQPEGFGLALEVLSFLAGVGLALPMCLLTLGALQLALVVRILLLVAFLLGLGVLLRFLFVYAHFLKGELAKPELPRHFWGLFTRRTASDG